MKKKKTCQRDEEKMASAIDVVFYTLPRDYTVVLTTIL
jgi:hypothetical protein